MSRNIVQPPLLRRISIVAPSNNATPTVCTRAYSSSNPSSSNHDDEALKETSFSNPAFYAQAASYLQNEDQRRQATYRAHSQAYITALQKQTSHLRNFAPRLPMAGSSMPPYTLGAFDEKLKDVERKAADAIKKQRTMIQHMEDMEVEPYPELEIPGLESKGKEGVNVYEQEVAEMSEAALRDEERNLEGKMDSAKARLKDYLGGIGRKEEELEGWLDGKFRTGRILARGRGGDGAVAAAAAAAEAEAEAEEGEEGTSEEYFESAAAEDGDREYRGMNSGGEGRSGRGRINRSPEARQRRREKRNSLKTLRGESWDEVRTRGDKTSESRAETAASVEPKAPAAAPSLLERQAMLENSLRKKT